MIEVPPTRWTKYDHSAKLHARRLLRGGVSGRLTHDDLSNVTRGLSRDEYYNLVMAVAMTLGKGRLYWHYWEHYDAYVAAAFARRLSPLAVGRDVLEGIEEDARGDGCLGRMHLRSDASFERGGLRLLATGNIDSTVVFQLTSKLGPFRHGVDACEFATAAGRLVSDVAAYNPALAGTASVRPSLRLVGWSTTAQADDVATHLAALGWDTEVDPYYLTHRRFIRNWREENKHNPLYRWADWYEGPPLEWEREAAAKPGNQLVVLG